MPTYKKNNGNSRYDEVLRQCLLDRKRIISSFQNTWTRRCCLDLLTKMLILHANSFGSKSVNVSVTYVDEVKNSNMQGILNSTSRKLEIPFSNKMVFHSFSPFNHVKIGRIRAARGLIVSLYFGLIYSLLFILKKDFINASLARALLSVMEDYIESMPKTKMVILVTDHHFFSTVLAMNSSAKSVVLQHGLIQDPSYFTPVHADFFFAWSERSAKIIKSNKAIVTGTYKFDNYGAKGSVVQFLSQSSNVLLILSGSKSEQHILKLIQPLLCLQEKYGFTLSVKMHPGSLFSIDELKKARSGYDINIYKEEPLDSIDFDFAFIEQSTAVIDIACLGIPYIVIDSARDNTYFGLYEQLPIVRSQRELIDLAEEFDSSDYTDAYQALLDYEVNGCVCRIKEIINDILQDV